MATQAHNTVIGVFHDRDKAREAIRDLKAAGFTDDQIGVASSNQEGLRRPGEVEGDESYAGEGAVTGVAAGAGIGALWGLGILAGVLPAIGPAIAGGTLAVLLSSAAAGAAAAGLTGALIGMGISKEEAEFYEAEMKSGRTIVTVNAGSRRNEALAIMQRFGGYDMSTRVTAASTASSTTAAAQGASHPVASSKQEIAGTNTACEVGQKSTMASSSAAGSTSAASGNTIRAHEEKVQVHKTPVKTGEVEVRKEVHTEHKTIEVPVTREEVVVERHPVAGEATSAADFQEGKQQIRIPVKEEQVSVEKQAVVTEEVTIGKRKVQDTERVSADLRKEEIKVEKHGDANVRDKDRK